MTFGERLRIHRLRLGVTQGRLAADAGMDTASVNHFECGRRLPSLANIIKLCDALKLPADVLLGREEPEDVQRATLRASFERYLDAVVAPVRLENIALRKALNEARNGGGGMAVEPKAGG